MINLQNILSETRSSYGDPISTAIIRQYLMTNHSDILSDSDRLKIYGLSDIPSNVNVTENQIVDFYNELCLTDSMETIKNLLAKRSLDLTSSDIEIQLDSGVSAVFQVDADSQNDIVRSISIFDALRVAAIAAGLPDMQWRLANNTMVIVTKADLQRLFDTAGVRKLQIKLSYWAIVELIKNSQTIPPNLKAMFEIAD